MIPRVPRGYAPHEQLVGPARVNADLWRLLLGTALCVLIVIGLGRAMVGLASRMLSPAAFQALSEGLDSARTPAGLLFLLFLVVPLGIGAITACEIVHRRDARTLLGPLPMAMQQGLRVLIALVLLYVVVGILPPWPFFRTTTPGLAFGTWVMLLPLTIIAILVQTASEELAFRGYLQSQIAARFGHPLIWMGVPSALFALGHHLPGVYGANAWIITVWAFLFGLAAADLTARSGTLGPAIALHMVNNFTALAITSMNSEMSGLSLFHLPFGPGDTAALRAYLPIDLALIGVTWLTARLALRV